MLCLLENRNDSIILRLTGFSVGKNPKFRGEYPSSLHSGAHGEREGLSVWAPSKVLSVKVVKFLKKRVAYKL